MERREVAHWALSVISLDLSSCSQGRVGGRRQKTPGGAAVVLTAWSCYVWEGWSAWDDEAHVAHVSGLVHSTQCIQVVMQEQYLQVESSMYLSLQCSVNG